MNKKIIRALSLMILAAPSLQANEIEPAIRKGSFSIAGFAGLSVLQSSTKGDVSTKGSYTQTTRTPFGPFVIITTENIGFSNAQHFKKSQNIFIPSAELGYGVSDNFEAILKGSYFKLDEKNFNLQDIKVANGTVISTKIHLPSVTGFTTHLGARYHFNLHKYIRPFVGGFFGGMWSKGNARFTLSGDVGIDVPLHKNISILAKAEFVGGHVNRAVSGTRTVNGSLNSLSQKLDDDHTRIGYLPFSLGLKIKL